MTQRDIFEGRVHGVVVQASMLYSSPTTGNITVTVAFNTLGGEGEAARAHDRKDENERMRA